MIDVLMEGLLNALEATVSQWAGLTVGMCVGHLVTRRYYIATLNVDVDEDTTDRRTEP